MTLSVLESSVLAAFRRGDRPSGWGGETDDWTGFTLMLALTAVAELRRAYGTLGVEGVMFKNDQSPVTKLDHDVEDMVRTELAAFRSDVVVVGEEAGGELPRSGQAMAVDPLDGTWAFVSGTGAAATSIAVFRNGSPFLAVVANPTYGEVMYASDAGMARLLRLSIFNEPDTAHDLPLVSTGDSKVLVNVHPGVGAGPLVKALFDAWGQKLVHNVRSPGGSPAWALAEAAKGRFTYVNLWPGRPAEAYDLAAGVLLVEAAGGRVVGLEGCRIDAVRHSGPFVAGVNPEARAAVLDIVKNSVDS